MREQRPRQSARLPDVSIAYVLEAQPSRAAAFRKISAALLHAGFDFGRTYPGRIVYSYDEAAEDYAFPICVPAGSVQSFEDAITHFDQVATYYNRSISLGFDHGEGAVPLSSRTYDEAGWLTVNLDFEGASWRRLVSRYRSTAKATNLLVDAGKTLFTLVPMTYLLIGPTSLLVDLPRVPTSALLRQAPIAMVARKNGRSTQWNRAKAEVEQLPRGTVVVRQWNAGMRAQHQVIQKRSASPPHP